MVSEFIFNLTRFNPHATKLWNLNIFNLKDQFDLTSNLISNRFNIMKYHDVIIKISYMIEIISNSRLKFFRNLRLRFLVHLGPSETDPGPPNIKSLLAVISGQSVSFRVIWVSYFEVLRYFNGIVLNLIQLVKVEK